MLTKEVSASTLVGFPASARTLALKTECRSMYEPLTEKPAVERWLNNSRGHHFHRKSRHAPETSSTARARSLGSPPRKTLAVEVVVAIDLDVMSLLIIWKDLQAGMPCLLARQLLSPSPLLSSLLSPLPSPLAGYHACHIYRSRIDATAYPLRCRLYVVDAMSTLIAAAISRL